METETAKEVSRGICDRGRRARLLLNASTRAVPIVAAPACRDAPPAQYSAAAHARLGSCRCRCCCSLAARGGIRCASLALDGYAFAAAEPVKNHRSSGRDETKGEVVLRCDCAFLFVSTGHRCDGTGRFLAWSCRYYGGVWDAVRSGNHCLFCTICDCVSTVQG